MCFHSKQSKDAQQLKTRFKAPKFKQENLFTPKIYNGFEYPGTPVITNKDLESIEIFEWGLIPTWANSNFDRRSTLNARYETINQVSSFKDNVNNRCLILADGFYEHQWIDPKGKKKQKYLISLPNDEAFAFAGIYCTNNVGGKIVNTYSILTMDANEYLATIHNNKKRMPLVLAAEHEKEWLKGGNPILQNDRLIATAI